MTIDQERGGGGSVAEGMDTCRVTAKLRFNVVRGLFKGPVVELNSMNCKTQVPVL